MQKFQYCYGALFLIAVLGNNPTLAGTLIHVGLTAGSAKTSSNDQFDASSSGYLFIGIQTEYYVTYEAGILDLNSDSPTRANNGEESISLATISALGHLPLGDSSLFARIGYSQYVYIDDKGKSHKVELPTYGAGIDFGIIPRITVRLEWQRYIDMEMNQAEFEVDTIRLGALYYF